MSWRPRILHVVNDLNVGGLERNLLALTRATGDCFDHHVCCIRERGTLADRFVASRVEVDALETVGRSHMVAWRIAQLCQRVRPHIVHTRNWGAIDGVVGARLARIPAVVHSEHGWDRPRLPRRRAWTLRALSPVIDAFVAVTAHLGAYLRDTVGVQESKISVIPNGVDGQRFRPVADRELLRRQLGLEPDRPIIIAVGRLEEVKNYPRLITVFSIVHRQRRDALLLIAGDGPARDGIKETVARLGLGDAVRLLGHRDDIENWLAAADIFTHAASSEGMTNAALEAMAAALPVVAANVGGLAEIVVEGVTGRLLEPAAEDAMAAALVQYCDDARMRAGHGAAGRERVLSTFTVEAMIRAYVGVYQRALAARGIGFATNAAGQ